MVRGHGTSRVVVLALIALERKACQAFCRTQPGGVERLTGAPSYQYAFMSASKKSDEIRYSYDMKIIWCGFPRIFCTAYFRSGY